MSGSWWSVAEFLGTVVVHVEVGVVNADRI